MAGLVPAIHAETLRRLRMIGGGPATWMPATSAGMTPERFGKVPYSSIFSAAINASCGISTRPNWRIFFLPSFCFSRSLRLRVTSPP